VVVVQGPRFSTRAESLWFKNMGWEVINMTQYPEVVLARELEICYLNISLITDYDVWQDNPVSHEEVVQVFDKNLENIRNLLFNLIPEVQKVRDCPCSSALQSARI
jgi:5'-methylthioadenosine phosphorylase